MRNRRLAALLSAIILLLPVSAFSQEAALLGFSPQTGMKYASFGRYPQGASGEEEAILWQVLRVFEGKALLLSDKVLDVQPAHAGSAHVGFEGSSLQKWLQQQFAPAAFDGQELAVLTQAEGLPFISLPSADQLRDETLGFLSGRERQAAPSAFAVAKGVLLYGPEQAGYWIFDKSQSMANGHRRVLENGNLGYTRAAADNIGVRPLISLEVGRLAGVLGDGSLESPYVFTPDGVPLPTATPSPVPTPVPTPAPVGSISIQGFPPLTEEGFLPEGQKEFVHIDEANGVWRYANQDLRIYITRHVDESVPNRWLTAEIFVRPGAENLKMFSHNPNPEDMLKDQSRYFEKPVNIAKNHGLVFAFDGDYFIYRLGRAKRENKKLAIGVVIRDGQLWIDQPASPTRNIYPPLDMMALFADGDMKVFKAGEVTAQELLDMGARDVLTFGPYLIKDGVINRTYVNYGTTLQPRAAIGMVQKGHYFAVIVEGRIRPSKGMTTLQVAELMDGLGCKTAFNLDGGWTSAMIFMGRQLNQLDKNGVLDNARTQNEVLGIGFTDAYQKGNTP